MVKERVARELQSALDALRTERAEIDEQIELMEGTLSKLGFGTKRKATKRKATRKKATRRKAGRPASKKKTAAKKKTAGKKKRAAKKKAAGKKKPHWSPAARAAARDRMRKYWADRRKKQK